MWAAMASSSEPIALVCDGAGINAGSGVGVAAIIGVAGSGGSGGSVAGRSRGALP